MPEKEMRKIVLEYMMHEVAADHGAPVAMAWFFTSVKSLENDKKFQDYLDFLRFLGQHGMVMRPILGDIGEDAAGIAAGLTPGEKKHLRRLGGIPLKRGRGWKAGAVRAKGLSDWADPCANTEILTPLGIAVRDHINRPRP